MDFKCMFFTLFDFDFKEAFGTLGVGSVPKCYSKRNAEGGG
jgi:hypothetical protein